MELKCDAVFEGGGVKGIGFAGAIAALQKRGYSFENVVGTSAGAIAASLIAAGYTGEEIKRELMAVSFEKFRQQSRFGRFGLIGKIVNLSAGYGIYRADYFENWLSGLLAKKNKRCFGDIKTGSENKKYKYKFQAIASDLTDNRMLVLPQDLESFGIDPDGFEIAKAVRMSMSIPLYYEPFRLTDVNGGEHIIADGGMLSNYPVWILDDGTKNPVWPTFGMKFSAGSKKQHHTSRKSIANIIDYVKSLIETMMEAGDKYHVSRSTGDFERSIMISTLIKIGGKAKEIKTTDFDISAAEGMMMAENGRRAVERFLANWDFESWKTKYR